MALADRGQRPLERGVERRPVVLDQLLGVSHRLADCRRGLRAGWDTGERVLIRARRGAQVTAVLEIGGLLQQRGQVARLQPQGFFEGVHLLRAPSERLEAARQVGPEGGMAGIRVRRPHKQRMRLLRRAPVEHAHAELVQHRRVIGSVLREAGQQLVGFGHPPGGRLGLGGLQRTNDRRIVQRCGYCAAHSRPRPLTLAPGTLAIELFIVPVAVRGARHAASVRPGAMLTHPAGSA